MRKYYTIEKTTWTSKPALEKMIATTAGKIGKPKKINKVDNVQKTFSHVWVKKTARNLKNDYAGIT